MINKNWNYETLNEAIFYEKETGLFFWKKKPKNGRGAVGQRAGHFGSNGYRYIRYQNFLYPEHRLAFFLTCKVCPQMVDHANGNSADNRFENLRICTASQNQWNKKFQKNNKSGFKGVSWNVRSKKWQAYIRIDGKNRFLGMFDDAKDAGEAYKKIASETRGSFYNELNIEIK